MTDRYDAIMHRFNRRYRLKKLVNLGITTVTAALGVTSFACGLRLESIRTICRWMTVDGTLFTTFSALAFIAVNLLELFTGTEMTRKPVYYLRLSSVVAESVIFAVVLISQLPFFAEHIPFAGRYDLLAMHTLIPVMSVASFLINDSPIGRLKPGQCWQGTWYVSFYALTIFTLIATHTLPEPMIPYFFLNYRRHAPLSVAALIVIYGIGYLMSRLLSEWNRKLSWIWFKDIARKAGPKSAESDD